MSIADFKSIPGHVGKDLLLLLLIQVPVIDGLQECCCDSPAVKLVRFTPSKAKLQILCQHQINHHSAKVFWEEIPPTEMQTGEC